jgi:hypothetical protein
MFISKEKYKQLVIDSETLQLLEAAGVDNWEGYSSALYSDDHLSILEKQLDQEIASLPD